MMTPHRNSIRSDLASRLEASSLKPLDHCSLKLVDIADFNEKRNLPSQQIVQFQLALIDWATLFLTFLTMLGITKALNPTFSMNEGWLLGLNVTLASGLFVLLQYADLTSGRYSLGKAVCLGLSMWLVNAILIASSTDVSVSTWIALAFGFGSFAAASGWIHYELSRPFMATHSPDHVYRRLELKIKRGFDWLSAVLGLAVLSPFLLIVLFLLFLECPCSPIFIQCRIGKQEKKFRMFKFRSMVVNADHIIVETVAQPKPAELYKRQDDPRVTRLGRIIRKLSIDELPQLLNVVLGEMSLVGPRPPILSEYQQMDRNHRRKFECTPGLTGLWQVTGRVKKQRNFSSVAAYDTYYVENWCLIEDLKILLKTIPVVLLQKGAC